MAQQKSNVTAGNRSEATIQISVAHVVALLQQLSLVLSRQIGLDDDSPFLISTTGTTVLPNAAPPPPPPSPTTATSVAPQATAAPVRLEAALSSNVSGVEAPNGETEDNDFVDINDRYMYAELLRTFREQHTNIPGVRVLEGGPLGARFFTPTGASAASAGPAAVIPKEDAEVSSIQKAEAGVKAEVKAEDVQVAVSAPAPVAAAAGCPPGCNCQTCHVREAVGGAISRALAAAAADAAAAGRPAPSLSPLPAPTASALLANQDGWYVVLIGRLVGVFFGWANAEPTVRGVGGFACHKSASRSQAEKDFLLAAASGNVKVIIQII
ncbi:hypothetical protein DXG01_008612 [Tephrocybe rancida]|nr:hypothetical protein DXG01_008612 [Tephrocybe rancida]